MHRISYSHSALRRIGGERTVSMLPHTVLDFPKSLPRRDLNSSFESHNVFRNE